MLDAVAVLFGLAFLFSVEQCGMQILKAMANGNGVAVQNREVCFKRLLIRLEIEKFGIFGVAEHLRVSIYVFAKMGNPCTITSNGLR